MIEIMRWVKHQHYHNRQYPPLWIKVFPKILDDPLYMQLSRDAQLLLVKLWLLTSQAKKDGKLPMNIIDIAWRLRMDEGEVLRLVEELAAVKDEDGEQQWMEWYESPLDAVLRQRLAHESTPVDGSADAPRIPIREAEGLLDHQNALAEHRNAESTGENGVGVDVSHRDYNKNENEKVPDDEKTVDPSADPPEATKSVDPEPKFTPENQPAPTGADRWGHVWPWLIPYAEPYEERFGAGSFDTGRAAKPLGLLRSLHGDELVLKHWSFYVETEPADYCNPQDFKKKFAEYDPDNQEQSTLTPHA